MDIFYKIHKQAYLCGDMLHKSLFENNNRNRKMN